MRRAIAIACLCWVSSAAMSCGGESASSYPIVVHATREGDPLGGVEITEGGYLLGETGADGSLALAVERPEGTHVELGARCPEGFRARPEHLEARLRRLERTSSGAIPPLELGVRCVRRVREVVVVVDAGRPDLPVLVDGNVVTRTNSMGLAHLWLEHEPGERFAVRIDTDARRDLAPPNPEQRYTVGAEDEVFYWGRPFDVPIAAAPGRPRGRSGSRLVERRPERLQ